MLDLVRAYVAENALLEGEGPVLLGVSGGIDSMALLHCLHALGYHLICAHFNHRLRPESGKDRDAAFAAARLLGVEFVEGEADVRAYGKERRLGLEEAARKLRYRFLFGEASRMEARAVVTAHTADDRVETLLMNLMRGTGLRGLRGMVPSTALPEFHPSIPAERPLLGVWREQIESYQVETGFDYVEDESNRDPAYFRNRVRHEILPFLGRFQPKLKSRLLRTAVSGALDEALLEQAAQAASDAALRERSDRWVGLEAAGVSGQPDAILARMLRLGVSSLRAGADELDYAAVERAIRLIRSDASTGSCDLTAGLRLIREYDRFWLAASEAELPVEAWPQVGQVDLTIESLPARVDLEGDWVLDIESIPPGDRTGGHPSDLFTAVLDAGALKFPLVIRGRRRGERFEPVGMGGKSKKLSDAMVDRKIPRRLRARWPLLVSDGKVVWVPGWRIGEIFAADGETTLRVRLRLFRR